jgi:hypothetical protein
VAFATAGWSFALTLGETANNSSIPISTGIATPATHILFLVIVLIPFYVDVRALFFFYGSLVSF